MSAERVTHITCDGCGQIEGDRTGDTAASIRRELRRQGWQVGSHGDLCPGCLRGERVAPEDPS